MIFKTFLLPAFILVSVNIFAQKQAANWYFGYSAGLNFNEGEPVLQRGKLTQWEGCATISDAEGKLLFYTNGGFVWNNKHRVMPNGKGLKGHNSSTQSSVIVPRPGSNNLYYLFTVTLEGAKDGLQYAVVDMNADNGQGDLIEKNISLLTPACEKIAAVMHANKKDVWVIAHRYNADEYCSYLVTEEGIRAEPVISKTGNVIAGGLNAIGYLKSSANGAKLAAAHMTSFIEVMDFNNVTGEITHPLKLIPKKGLYPYGVEFSRAAEFLYITEMEHVNGMGAYTISQYRVSASADSLLASKHTVASGNVGGAAGALQLAPDNKIYIAFNRKNYLGCILYPEKAGNACGFDLEHISLSNTKSGLGLPSFIQSYLLNSIDGSSYFKYVAGLVLLLILILLFWWLRKKKSKKQ